MRSSWPAVETGNLSTRKQWAQRYAKASVRSMNLGNLCNYCWYWIMLSETGCMVSSPDGWHLDFGRATSSLQNGYAERSLPPACSSSGSASEQWLGSQLRRRRKKVELHLKWVLLPTKKWSTESLYFTGRGRWPSYFSPLHQRALQGREKQAGQSHMSVDTIQSSERSVG